MTLSFPDTDMADIEPWEVRDRLEHAVDLVINVEHCPIGATTVINLTGDIPVLEREGLGDLAAFGF
jgi:tRNA A37 threonylcarbamoyladenosine synthetase subunit TsaC/SUA5/YrdC